MIIKWPLFGIAVLILVFAISPNDVRAQAKKLWVAPKAGIWRVKARDEENVNWIGRARLSKAGAGSSVEYRGYFYWVSEDKQTSGREYFTGSFARATGKLKLKAYKVRNIRGELGIGNYSASVNGRGKNIFSGTWSGDENVPGKWSAIWSGPGK